jgi:hypothetical protein
MAARSRQAHPRTARPASARSLVDSERLRGSRNLSRRVRLHGRDGAGRRAERPGQWLIRPRPQGKQKARQGTPGFALSQWACVSRMPLVMPLPHRSGARCTHEQNEVLIVRAGVEADRQHARWPLGWSHGRARRASPRGRPRGLRLPSDPPGDRSGLRPRGERGGLGRPRLTLRPCHRLR